MSHWPGPKGATGTPFPRSVGRPAGQAVPHGQSGDAQRKRRETDHRQAEPEVAGEFLKQSGGQRSQRDPAELII